MVGSGRPTGTRRGFLRTGAAGLAATTAFAGSGLALTGCGGSAASGRSPHRGALGVPGESDVDLLNAVLAAEQRAIAAYTAVTPLLTGLGQRAASTFLAQDLDHAGELRALILRIGGQPLQPTGNYNFGGSSTRSEILALLHDVERDQIAAHLRAISGVSDRLLRAALASMMANDAQHVAVLRAEQGLVPLTDAVITADV